MQKFEFCTIDISYGTLVSFTPSGWKEVSLKKDINLGDKSDADATARTIAQLGLDGWELVGGVSPTGRSYGSVLYFRRTVP